MKKKIFSLSAISLLLLLAISFYLYNLYSNIYQRSGRPLAYLTVPRQTQVYLPEPLELPSISTSVLGAQVIDPKDIVTYINFEREKVGSKLLRISPTLMKAAQMRADVILKYQNFSHQDPYESIELVTVLPKLNYHFVYASENIGMGGTSAQDFVFGFMHSTSHKDNLLNPNLSDTGAAVVTGQYKQYYVNIVVQLFAIPAGKKELLGYDEREVKKYRQQLADVETKLNPFIWALGKFIGNKDFTDENHKKLAHQKEILKLVYTQMKAEKPLTNQHVMLILEYNNNLL